MTWSRFGEADKRKDEREKHEEVRRKEKN